MISLILCHDLIKFFRSYSIIKFFYVFKVHLNFFDHLTLFGGIHLLEVVCFLINLNTRETSIKSSIVKELFLLGSKKLKIYLFKLHRLDPRSVIFRSQSRDL